MQCERCGGLTIGVAFSGGETATRVWEYTGRKCLNCGFVTDPLIAKNRNGHTQRARQQRPAAEAGRSTHTFAEIAA
jgi:hypothetical protein